MFGTVAGVIPPELGRLDALTALHLGGNGLSGKGDVARVQSLQATVLPLLLSILYWIDN